MTSKDFNKLSSAKLAKMNFSELKKLVSEQGQQANKRYQRIKGNKKAAQNAVNQVSRSGGRFSVKGKNTHASLEREAKRIQSFNKSKTGTVKGAIEVKEASQIRAKGKTAKQAGLEKRKQYEKEEKEKARNEAKKKGKKLSKTKRKAIERKARKIGKEAEKEFAEEVDKSYESFKKKRKEKEDHDRGAYYNAPDDGKGAGTSGNDSDSDQGSPEETEDVVETEEFMGEDTKGNNQSPYNINDDDDFLVPDESIEMPEWGIDFYAKPIR